MRTRADLRLREEAARFALRFACDDCAHFDAERARCAHEYPPGPRRDALTPTLTPEGASDPTLSFCKEFELG